MCWNVKYKKHFRFDIISVSDIYIWFSSLQRSKAKVDEVNALGVIFSFPHRVLFSSIFKHKYRNFLLPKSGSDLTFIVLLLHYENRISLSLNMYFASLKYTSPSFVTSMVNTISSLTFINAVALRWVVEVWLPLRLIIFSELL